MKPWIKFCIILSTAYAMLSTLIYVLSVENVPFWGILVIGLTSNLIMFLIYKDRPERIPMKGEIIRLKNPLVGLYERIKNVMEVKK